jgi:predicted transcriptional regulator
MIQTVKKEQDDYYVSIEYHLQELHRLENLNKEDKEIRKRLKELEKENTELREKIKELLRAIN